MFLDSFSVISAHWIVFAAFLTAIIGLYLLEYFVKPLRRPAMILNLAAHTALVVYSVTVGAGLEVILLLLLAAAVPALLV